ncbi:hypothetical protein BDV95DRAFT_582143, partial [Massariosphaeria phaeospora]
SIAPLHQTTTPGKLRALTLWKVETTPACVENFLASGAFPNLRTLEIQFPSYEDLNQADHWARYDYSRLKAILARHQPALQELDVRVQRDSFARVTPLGDLRNLVNLRMLRVSLPVFIKSAQIPTQLLSFLPDRLESVLFDQSVWKELQRLLKLPDFVHCSRRTITKDSALKQIAFNLSLEGNEYQEPSKRERTELQHFVDTLYFSGPVLRVYHYSIYWHSNSKILVEPRTSLKN